MSLRENYAANQRANDVPPCRLKVPTAAILICLSDASLEHTHTHTDTHAPTRFLFLLRFRSEEALEIRFSSCVLVGRGAFICFFFFHSCFNFGRVLMATAMRHSAAGYRFEYLGRFCSVVVFFWFFLCGDLTRQ